MPVICLHDRSAIEQVLRRDIYLNLYAIGDLDDFFWPYTTWLALPGQPDIRQVLLLYTATEVPTLVAHGPRHSPELRSLLLEALPVLPRSFYAHINPEFVPLLAEYYESDSHGLHYKMALRDPARLSVVDISATEPLSAADLEESQRLYRESYPGNWFDPRMLLTGQYYGIRRDGRLISIAGIHVYSPEYGVAALGNITTHPHYRGQGLGSAVTARLCRELLRSVRHIGLNVKADNAAAIASYRRLGFEKVAGYEECLFTARRESTL